AAHRNPRRSQIVAGGLAANAGLTLNAAERPAEAAGGENLLLTMCFRNVPHADAAAQAPPRGQRLGRRPSGNGRFGGVHGGGLHSSRRFATSTACVQPCRSVSINE